MQIDGIVAPNPGPMTGSGTNTWIVAVDDECVIVDPGPVDEGHLAQIIDAVASTRPVGVLITHTHPDHAPLANRLADELSVAAIGAADGPEFTADRRIVDGDTIAVGSEAMVAVATPGHTADSTSYRIGSVLLSGDHIIGGSTVVVEDMAAYMTSLERLASTGLTRIHPGHGPTIDDPDAVIGDYLAHRRSREQAILDAVEGGADSITRVVEAVYRDVDPALHAVAAVSVAAHLRKLANEGRIDPDGTGERLLIEVAR